MKRTRGLTALVGMLAVSGGLVLSAGPAAAGGQPIPGVDIILKKNPGGASVRIGEQVYTVGAPVSAPDVRVQVFENEVVVEIEGRTFTSGFGSGLGTS